MRAAAWCALGAAIALHTTGASAEVTSARPNLLLLVAEDLSPRIGAAGDAHAHTPHIDALAREGVRYTRVFTTAGVCAPSRAALITGRHAISIGAQHMRASSRPAGGYRSVPPPDVKAFPELLRAAGYYTFVTTKLDYQFSGTRTGSGPFTIWDAEDDAALWAGRDPGQPFFGMLTYMQTHESGVFRPIGSWPHSVMHLLVQLWRAWLLGWGEPAAVVDPADLRLPPYYPDTATVRADLARHYANVAAMDEAVGEVLERLEADGLAGSTIVVWTTDHGDGLPRAKRELYDSGLHVPLIVRWPEAQRPAGIEPGSTDDRLVSFVDLAPTLLEMAGVEAPSGLHGQSFARAEAPRRDAVFAARDRVDEVPDRQRAVRDERYKYIRSWHPEQPGGHRLAFRDDMDMMRELWRLREQGALDSVQRQWFEPPGRERLFDTLEDPHEIRDVSADPAYRGVLERMRGQLDAWLARVGDWSDVSEDEMVAGFAPGGDPPRTPAPILTAGDGRVRIDAPTPGASVCYRIGDDRWRLYVAPFGAPAGATVTARAVRYGWEASDEVSYRLAPTAEGGG